MKKISTIDEYLHWTHKGFCPLCDWRNFTLDIKLRVKLQHDIFGTGNNPKNNEKFYRWVWDHRPHYCEETMYPLSVFSAVHISHILSRGSHPEMAYDCRNVNILTFKAHQQWENGNRKWMRIYEENQLIIELLKKDYSKD